MILGTLYIHALCDFLSFQRINCFFGSVIDLLSKNINLIEKYPVTTKESGTKKMCLKGHRQKAGWPSTQCLRVNITGITGKLFLCLLATPPSAEMYRDKMV